MVAANLAIITDLKDFLNEVCVNADLRKTFVTSPVDFSRNRLLTLKHLVGIILNMPKRSLTLELLEFYNHLLTPALAVSKAAFSQQRGKLSPDFFHTWNDLLVKSYYRHYSGSERRWRGYLLYAVDGSRVYLVNTPEVISYFGTQHNQSTHVAMAQVLQVHDVLNDIIVNGTIEPFKTSEQSILSSNISWLREDAIVLLDRGYPGFSLIYQLKNQPVERPFVMRCKEGFNITVKEFMEGKQKDTLVTFRATKRAAAFLRNQGYDVRAGETVEVRLVKVKLPGNAGTEVLITNLYDKKKFTTGDLRYLYSLRWGVETSFGTQKNTLQLEQFSGNRTVCIKQDYFATILVYNLQSLIEKQSEAYVSAVSKKRKYRYKINRNVACGALKNTLFLVFFKNEPREILHYLQRIFEKALEPVRPGRKY